jgi:ribosomal protein S18 acetylase RimI-like enzyme
MVRLAPMDAGDLKPYLEQVIRSYADDNVRAGRWTAEQALGESRKQIEGLLSAGLETPGHFLFSIVSEPEGEKVGILWLAVEPQRAFVYDLEVFANARRRGHAEAAMRLAEDVARSKGASRIMLNVFGDNVGARRLYDKLGYRPMATAMAKPLGP